MEWAKWKWSIDYIDYYWEVAADRTDEDAFTVTTVVVVTVVVPRAPLLIAAGAADCTVIDVEDPDTVLCDDTGVAETEAPPVLLDVVGFDSAIGVVVSAARLESAVTVTVTVAGPMAAAVLAAPAAFSVTVTVTVVTDAWLAAFVSPVVWALLPDLTVEFDPTVPPEALLPLAAATVLGTARVILLLSTLWAKTTFFKKVSPICKTYYPGPMKVV
jgi:hypothetical protein